MQYNKYDIKLLAIAIAKGYLLHHDFEVVHKSKISAKDKKNWFIFNNLFIIKNDTFYPVDIEKLKNIVDEYSKSGLKNE